MTKEQLIRALNDPEFNGLKVLIASDSEGNSFSHISEMSLEDFVEDEIDDIDVDGPVLVLWPF